MQPPAADPPSRAVRDQLGAEYAGTGMWGTLYRAPDRRRWYRLIPGSELGASQRSQLLEWRARPRRRGLAPVLDDGQPDQRSFGEQWFQVVCYQTDATRSLADVIADADPRARVATAASAIRALPDWWRAVGPGLVPMPADIVMADGRPALLPLPSWGLPSVWQILAEPERIAHLSPDAVRGTRVPGRAEDLFSLAVMASRCLAVPREDDAERMLHRAASGTTHSPVHGRPGRQDSRYRNSRIPFWMQRVEPVRAALTQLTRLTCASPSAREHADPADLAVLLEQAANAMNPLTAMRAARDKGDPRQAVDLAHAVLVDDPAYDILLLAAQIADKDLDAPLEALSFLDRAVQADPGRAEAYEAQLSVIDASADMLPYGLAPDIQSRLDQTLRTAFGKLPPARRRERAHELIGYLIGRGELREANEQAHKWLHDDAGILMWWKFDLMLDYTETFILLGHRAQALALVAEIKKGLRIVLDNKQMSRTEIHEAGMRLARLERYLRENPHGGDMA